MGAGRVDEAMRLARESDVSAALVPQLRHTIAVEQKARATMDSEIRASLEQEAKAREDGDHSLMHSMKEASEALQDALRQQESIDSRLEEGREIRESFSMLREGIAKVVEAIQ